MKHLHFFLSTTEVHGLSNISSSITIVFLVPLPGLISIVPEVG